LNDDVFFLVAVLLIETLPEGGCKFFFSQLSSGIGNEFALNKYE
jgi:hypothetical protein